MQEVKEPRFEGCLIGIVRTEKVSTLGFQLALRALKSRANEYVGFPESLAAGRATGAVIAIVDESGLTWGKAFGFVDAAPSRPVDMETLFSIQSMP